LSARLDLTGTQLGQYITREGASAPEWQVERKAPAQQRKAFWTLTHTPCGGEIDLPHTLVLPVTQGKGTLPPCTGCTPADVLPTVSHGQHLACGKTHMVGTPCGADPYEPRILLQMGQAPEWKPLVDVVRQREVLDLDAFASEEDEAPRELDLDALDAEPMPRVITLDLAAYAEVDPSFVPEVHQPVTPAEHALVAATDAEYAARAAAGWNAAVEKASVDLGLDPAFGQGGYGDPYEPTEPAWRITDSDAPPATLNREFRDVLLAPMHEAMAGHERNGQVMPGPSAVGGCRRKLAHQLLYADEFEAQPSGWAAMKGTVLHAWYERLCRPAGWFPNLALPQLSPVVAGGTLDLYVNRTVVDLKAPGTTTMKAARAGRLSNGYYAQAQVYGMGAEALGLVVEKVGLLVVPMCGDNLDDAVYWEWIYDRSVAEAALADAERIVADPRDRAEVLASMPTKSDFCSSCPAFGRHCAGAAGPVMPATPRGGLELVR
jgi:hypothetical protein